VDYSHVPACPDARGGRTLGVFGGQFQFRLDDGTTCEMYWLNADSIQRDSGEVWADYVHRSRAEVRTNFEKLILTTDFAKEALNWQVRVDFNKRSRVRRLFHH